MSDDPRPTVADETPDWTVKDGRSNSSDVYEECVATVGRLIRGSAHDIVAGNTGAVARMVVSQLAHTGPRLTPAGGEGICGDEAPDLFVNCSGTMPAVCELRHGHASEWHEDGTGKRWRLTRGRSVEKALDDAVAHLADEEALRLEVAAEVAALRSRLTEVERERDDKAFSANEADLDRIYVQRLLTGALVERDEARAERDRMLPVVEAAKTAVANKQIAGSVAFDECFTIAPEDSVRDGWYRAECDWCDWGSSGSEPVVEEAAAEHLTAEHLRLIRLATEAVDSALLVLRHAVDHYSSTVHPPTPETPNGH